MEKSCIREIVQTSRFKSDLKKLARSGRQDVEELLTVIDMLASDKMLPEKFKDHPLTDEWQDHRDCHIRPDWLLIYRLEHGRLILVRSGSHSALYK